MDRSRDAKGDGGTETRTRLDLGHEQGNVNLNMCSYCGNVFAAANGDGETCGIVCAIQWEMICE